MQVLGADRKLKNIPTKMEGVARHDSGMFTRQKEASYLAFGATFPPRNCSTRHYTTHSPRMARC